MIETQSWCRSTFTHTRTRGMGLKTTTRRLLSRMVLRCKRMSKMGWILFFELIRVRDASGLVRQLFGVDTKGRLMIDDRGP